MKTIYCLTLLALLQLHAVEVGPYKVTKVVDGDTIKIQTDLGERTIRILYVDTPESKDNSHGKAMPEGLKAKAWLTTLLKDKEVKLWGPGKEIEQDRYRRLLADPLFLEQLKSVEVDKDGNPVVVKGKKKWSSLAAEIIVNGHSPYWRKYGDAPKGTHNLLMTAHKLAKELQDGAWATAPKYMQDKSNERSKPKDETKEAMKALDNAIVDELYKAALKEGKTHWKSKSGVRHNKDCQWFGKTKDGAFCKDDEGVACGKCGG